MPRLGGEDAVGELLGRHLEREEADDAALALILRRAGEDALEALAGDGEGDIGGEGGLAHGGARGKDGEIALAEAAELLVENAQARGEAGEAAAAAVGGIGDLHGGERPPPSGPIDVCRCCGPRSCRSVPRLDVLLNRRREPA